MTLRFRKYPNGNTIFWSGDRVRYVSQYKDSIDLRGEAVSVGDPLISVRWDGMVDHEVDRVRPENLALDLECYVDGGK